ncbi:SurA N-terminal domain-containing protein [Limisalsivibrio acetivorans]|uniref:SurA N-terminal domain-containing protein n=1 Tax=Limisalsivibrio acetivorans TaxID=1304888 RepID=UPI0003B71247|nr:SurA N-terminal domain-containing protein [Limisalsivibrio acetivorans]
MLTSFRKSKKVTQFALWFIIIAFIVTIFFVWGVGSQQADANYFMRVNGQKVTYDEYLSTLERTRNYFKGIFGDNFDSVAQGAELEKQVLNDLINRYILMQEAEENGVPVSDEEVLQLVMQIPAFQKNGQFDRDTYQTLLARNRMTPQEFEAMLKVDHTVSKMQSLISSAVAVSDAEIEKEYIYRKTRASIEYMMLDADDFAHRVKPEQEVLEEYFHLNSEAYRIPQKRKVKYVEFDPTDFKSEVEITNEEIETYYIKNKDQFYQPEKVQARHILFLIEDWNDKENVEKNLEKANRVLKELEEGAEFAELAKKYSADSSAQNGGDLGYFTRGQMVPEFEEAAFNLEPGEVSGIVKTMYGYHIIKVEDKVEEYDPTLDEVKGIIAKSLESDKLLSKFKDRVFEIYTEVVKASNLTAYNDTAEKKLDIEETGYFSQDQVVDPISGNPEAIKAIFGLAQSEVSQVTDIMGKKYIFEVVDIQEARVPEFSEVRNEVREDYIAEQALDIAKEEAENAIAEGSMEAAAEKLNLTYSTTPKFFRNDSIPGIGMNLELMDSAFSNEPGTFLEQPFVNGGNVFIVRVKEHEAPDMDLLADSRDEIETSIYSVKSETALNSYLDSKREKAEIEINPRYSAIKKLLED